MNKKIKKIVEIGNIADRLKHQGKKIAFCNGCFDILHMGHIKFLEEAKNQGDILIVGLNSDSSIRKSKGKGRPINREQNRAGLLAALQFVDYVVIFSQENPIKLIQKIRPDVFVNGEEYGKDCIEKKAVEECGGRIHLVKKVPGLSTSKLVEKIIGQR